MTEFNESAFIKDEQEHLIPMHDIKIFINTIAGEHDKTFENVVVYGCAATPLFLLKTVRELLQIPRSTLQDNISDFDEGEEIFKDYKVQLIIKKNGKEFIKRDRAHLLTEYGLYNVLFLCKKPIGKVFRKFIHVVLKKLKEEQIVYLKDALHERDVLLRRAYEKNAEKDMHMINLNFALGYLNKSHWLDKDKQYYYFGNDKKYTYCLERKFFKKTASLYIVDYVRELERLAAKILRKAKSKGKKKVDPDEEEQDVLLTEEKLITKEEKLDADDRAFQNNIESILEKPLKDCTEEEIVDAAKEYYQFPEYEKHCADYKLQDIASDCNDDLFVFYIAPLGSKAKPRPNHYKIDELRFMNKEQYDAFMKYHYIYDESIPKGDHRYKKEQLKKYHHTPFKNTYIDGYMGIIGDMRHVYCEHVFSEYIKADDEKAYAKIKESLDQY